MTEEPELREVEPGQLAACHWSEEITTTSIDVAMRAAEPVATAEPAAS